MKDSSLSLTSPTSNHPCRVQGALILAQIFFGLGAVVGALGLPATNPLVFALAREFWAGLILLAISVYYLQTIRDEFSKGGTLSSLKKESSTTATTTTSTLVYALGAWRVHWKSFLLLGFVVFGNQAGFIVGIKLAGPVTASVWQPCQPIFTAAICMALGWEPLQPKRIAGIALAFAGCIAMVLLKPQSASIDNDDDEETSIQKALAYVIGNALFFINCLCTSLYVILSKRMLTIYPALLVTAWSYNFASIYMLGATLLASAWPAAQILLCPDCEEASLWHIAPGTLPALVYYIVFASVASYGLLTWANQYATGTLVMSFTVLQPTTTALVTTSLLMTGLVDSCRNNSMQASSACLDYPSWGTFCGMGGVLLGLALIITTEATAAKRRDDLEEEHDNEMTAPLTTIDEDSSMHM